MKKSIKFFNIAIIILAGAGVFSCTYGVFEGTGGGGNLDIYGIPAEYQYCFITVDGTLPGTSDAVSFHPSFPILRIPGSSRVTSPLYLTANNAQYRGSEKIILNFKIYDDAAAANLKHSKTFTVEFFSGSAGLYWRE